MHSSSAKRAAVVGRGAFGHALARVLQTGGIEVSLHGRPTLASPAALHDLATCDIIVLATPAQALRAVCTTLNQSLGSRIPPLLSACKGIEFETLLLPHQVMQQCLPPNSLFGTLSGPSFAQEMLENKVTSVVVASLSDPLLDLVEVALHRDTFRVYRSHDVVGVELGGALKNVIAMVAGAVDGLGLGNNARAAVITRGLQEIAQIGLKMGASPLTFLGLSGLGDLILTCTGDMSRNRQFGLRCAKGESPDQITAALGQVVEGVTTSQAAAALSAQLGLDTPILSSVSTVVRGEKSMKEALSLLMSRPHKAEFQWFAEP
jgi:glycerol-3-phosphate dehydrogenase (NAD(P)+)